MNHLIITDFDAAYGNSAAIADASSFPPRWARQATTFREALLAEGRAELDIAYADLPRNTLDLFMPRDTCAGLVVFVHGGYWRAFAPKDWSHLAAGPLSRGYAVAMAGYTLCPDARIAEITQEIAKAVTHAAQRVSGPVILTGHSAGGHLVSRMVSDTSPLEDSIAERVVHTLSISGVHDLRPLMQTEMNESLAIDLPEAIRESPVLLAPRPGTRLTCWVGADELPEFVRQNAALASAWLGLGAAVLTVEEPNRHHFTVIDGLADGNSPLTEALLGSAP